MTVHLDGGSSNGGIATGDGSGCAGAGGRGGDIALGAAGGVRKPSIMALCVGIGRSLDGAAAKRARGEKWGTFSCGAHVDISETRRKTRDPFFSQRQIRRGVSYDHG